METKTPPSKLLRLAVVPAVFLFILLAGAGPAPGAEPSSVTVAGSLQSELGCAGDWDPACTASQLNYDSEDKVWQRTWTVPAGSWEYKAALNGSWTENYGAGGVRDGANIPLNLGAPASVKFYYDNATHWITSSANSIIATVPGNFQSELGCSADWDPSCLRSWLQDLDNNGTYEFATTGLPAGNYEAKVAINENWTENYGAGGVQNGPNITFTVPSDCARMRFSYNSTTHVLTITAEPATPPQPSAVTVAGGFQSELGCPGDWLADCATTHLTYDATDQVWQGTWSIPAGSWEYKATINDSWTENYGANATPNGPNIGLNLTGTTSVKFYYDTATHWITDNKNKVIATAAGSFQSEMGCPGDWDPGCLRSWLQDPDGDGIYTFSTSILPAGSYETKVAINEGWAENYGDGGVPNGPNISFTVPAPCTEMFFSYNATTHILTISASGAPAGNLNKAKAHWVARDLILWNPPAYPANSVIKLHHAANGGLALTGAGVTGETASVPLTLDPAGPPPAIVAKFPHLAAYKAFRIASGDVTAAKAFLTGQLAVSVVSPASVLVDATSLQIPGVLDDYYTYAGPLGVTFSSGVPTVRLWAPTAKSVTFLLYNTSSPTESPTRQTMTLDPNTGVWSVTGTAGWYAKYYMFEVQVWVGSTVNVETNLVTDPYSVSLSMNSTRSQIIDLNDPALKPAGWDGLAKPALDAPEDIALYELHVRDFSINDTTVPAAQQGTFAAFAFPNSNGMNHVRRLAQAGLTHVHLLPSFDFATVQENRALQQVPAGDLSSFPPDSDQQQAAVNAVRDADGFNWGYDPYHYSTPEGSYSTNPEGSTRILEFRQMVQGLASAGLRTVMDVVYNHTTAAGQSAPRSVLDRIVPGYYHRLNLEGTIETSSCCPNTASEHAMMEKLMIDSLTLWATAYKVDGFRFDLMGHHMKSNMLNIKAKLQSLTPATDGVDGSKIYLYGEAWNFGEVANNARGVNAIQANMAGTGIGSFNDRIRDGVRGGGPFSGIQEQGFITGLFTDPNATNQGPLNDQRLRLLHMTDWVKISMAGGLKTGFTFIDSNNNLIEGWQLDYNGQQSGYTLDPQELINYVSAHDNDTIFDAIQLKAPVATSLEDRVKIQKLGMAILGLGQGIPFFHAGDEMLRSKSLDRNSYNSGDWFNKLDFTYQSNNWGVGLPPAGDNQSNWPVMQPLLANPSLKPLPVNISRSVANMVEILNVRRSSQLFRLRTQAEVGQKLRFYNGGPAQIPGVLAYSLAENDPAGFGGCSVVSPGSYPFAVVVINADKVSRTFSEGTLSGKPLTLHPYQVANWEPGLAGQTSYNRGAGSFTVPGRTAAVFVCSMRPTAVVTGSATICAGQSTPITATLTGTGPFVVTWSDGVVQNVAASPAVRMVSPTFNMVFSVVKLSDANYADSTTGLSGQAVITVKPTPSSLITAPSGVCTGSTGNTASVPDGGPGTTYSWTISAGSTITSGAGTRSITFAAGSPGSLVLSVTVTKDACPSTSSKTIAIDTTPAAPVPQIPANAGTTQSSFVSWTHPGNATFDVYLDTVSPPQKLLASGLVNNFATGLPAWFPGVTYYWQVVARNGCGTAPSPVWSFTAGACSWTGQSPALISPPPGATTQPSTLLVQWAEVLAAAHYDIYVGSSPASLLRYRSVPAPQTSLRLNLASGKVYYWKVVAVPVCGTSAAASSSVASFETAGSSLSLSALAPGFVNRWEPTELVLSGTGFTAQSVMFTDRNGTAAGTLTPSVFVNSFSTPTSLVAGLTPNLLAPAGRYDTGVRTGGLEDGRLLSSLALRAYTDVTEADWYFESTALVGDLGIMESDADPAAAAPQFLPAAAVTRALMAEYLGKAYQWNRTRNTALPPATCVTPDFADVACSHPNWLAIHWLKVWGVTAGSPCPQGLCYLPDNAVNRAEIMTFLERLKQGAALPSLLSSVGEIDPGCSQPYPTCSGWTDPGLKTAGWPRREFNVAFADRLTTGCAGTPGNGLTGCVFDVVTRAQIAELLARSLGLVPNP
ncbi:MAG: pullulanase-type alpha-1,6-glucosidase [Thermoanaerobaculia bacterium]|nr:pullulanase-type alpha-1,6-glucosidase [Thermoanaerobaculia bacterium]